MRQSTKILLNFLPAELQQQVITAEINRDNMMLIDRHPTPMSYADKRNYKKSEITAHDRATVNPILRQILRDMQA